MNCVELRTLVGALPLHELTSGQLQALDRHAGTCSACRVSVAQARALESLLRALPDPAAPSRITDEVMSRIASLEREHVPSPVLESRGRRSEPSGPPDWQLFGVAAAAAAGLGAYLVGLLDGSGGGLAPLWIGGWLDGMDVIGSFSPAGAVVALAVVLYVSLSRSPHRELGKEANLETSE